MSGWRWHYVHARTGDTQEWLSFAFRTRPSRAHWLRACAADYDVILMD